MTNYNDGKWYGWNGGECPVHPETVVEVATAQRGVIDYPNRRAGITKWGSDGDCVIAFRVIKEHKEPREFWILGDQLYANKKDAMEERRYASLNAALYFKKHPGEIIHVREVQE